MTLGCGLHLTERSHRVVFNSRLAVSRRQVRPRVVPTLVVVVLHIQAGEFGKTDAQSAARVVDVLSIQGLRKRPQSYRTAS